MACDQLEYCGGCQHYETCKARKGEGECPCAKEKEQ